MKCKVEIEVNVPREKVVRLYMDRARFFEWCPFTKRNELISGENGEVNSKYRIVHETMGRTYEFDYTITENQLPQKIGGTGVQDNEFSFSQTTWFKEIEPEKTLIVQEMEHYIDRVELDTKQKLVAFKECVEQQLESTVDDESKEFKQK